MKWEKWYKKKRLKSKRKMGILNYFEWSHITSCKNDTQNTFILSSIFPPHIRNFFAIFSRHLSSSSIRIKWWILQKKLLCRSNQIKAVYFLLFVLCLFQLVNDSPWCFLYFLIINIDLHEIRVNTKEFSLLLSFSCIYLLLA